MDFSVRDILFLKYTPDLGPARIRNLISAFGSIGDIQSSTTKDLCRLDGFDEILSKKVLNGIRQNLKDKSYSEKIEKQIDLAEKYKSEILTILDSTYPENLKSIYDAPVVLYIRGSIQTEDEFSIAVVGSRNVSEYGTLTAERIASDLAVKGITVVSGMATGIDSYAHWGCLRSGGRTIAVLGNGLDYVYPSANKKLYDEIVENGAVISEYPFGTKPLKDNFPGRNRIISGLSLGTLIVEASKRSGALITAKYALEQNKEVFAIPGNVSSSRSEGTNMLIRDCAAKLVLTADDILTELEPKLSKLNFIRQERDSSLNINISESEKRVYHLIEDEPTTVDAMVQKSGLSLTVILTDLLTLELKGHVKKLPGNKYVRI
ncbi:DNA-processing protein DprA [candidate division KSB1 bacterium]